GFAGDATSQPSGASRSFTINPVTTGLALSGPASAQVGTASNVKATLLAGATPIPFKTVWFVVTGPPTSIVAAETNLAGEAQLGLAPGVGGQYSITACFSEPSPLGVCPAAASPDDTYSPAVSLAKPFAATWPFGGFLAPVDPLPALNSAK